MVQKLVLAEFALDMRLVCYFCNFGGEENDDPTNETMLLSVDTFCSRIGVGGSPLISLAFLWCSSLKLTSGNLSISIFNFGTLFSAKFVVLPSIAGLTIIQVLSGFRSNTIEWFLLTAKALNWLSCYVRVILKPESYSSTLLLTILKNRNLWLVLLKNCLGMLMSNRS